MNAAAIAEEIAETIVAAPVEPGGWASAGDLHSWTQDVLTARAVQDEVTRWTVRPGRPLQVQHQLYGATLSITCTTAPAGRAGVLRQLLELRAREVAADVQLVVFTRGAGVGLPAWLGGLPLFAVPLVGR